MLNSLFNILNISPWVFLISVAFIGVIFGSFLNVVIARMPPCLLQHWRRECVEFLKLKEDIKTRNVFLSLISPGSSCPKCKKHIRFYDNVPLISYIILRGKCRDCSRHISLRYPFIEFLTAILSVIVAYKFGVTWQTVGGLILTWVLIVQATIDLDNTFIPDEITVPMIWIGLLLSIVPVYVTSNTSIIGAVAGYLSLWLIFWLFYLATGKEGMGQGDFKLLAMLGAWLGWQILPFVILFSSVLGSIVGVMILIITKQDRNTQIPFGPYLAIAGWLALVWGADINSWYLTYIGIIN